MRRIITWTYYFLASLLPLIFLTNTFELFEFPKFLLLLSGTLVISAVWLFYIYTSRDFSVLPAHPHPQLGRWLHFLHWSILAVLLTQAVATIFSLHPYTSFWGYYSRFHQGLLTTICYTILYFAAIKWLDHKSTQKIINISVKTAIFISLIAILEHYNISLTCYLMTVIGWLQNSANPLILTTACWGNLTNPLNRSFATLGQPNWLAAYLIPHIFLLLYQIRLKSKSAIPYLQYIPLALLFFALVVTRSRSGFLAFGVSYFGYWYLSLRQMSLAQVRRPFTYLTILFIIVGLSVGTPLSPSISELFARQSTAVTTQPTGGTALETGGTESGSIRQIVWTGAIRSFLAHPILGTGPETFAYTYYAVRPIEHNLTSEWDYLYNKAHNEYLNFAATSGLIGLLAYLSWHAALGAMALIRIPATKKIQQSANLSLRAFLPVIGASLIAFTVSNFFGFSVIPVYYLILILGAFGTTLTNLESNSSPNPPSAPLLLFLIPLVLIYPLRLYLADHYLTYGKAALTELNQPAQSVATLTRALSYRPGLDLVHSYLGEAYAALALTAAGSTDETVKAQTPGYISRALAETEVLKKLNPVHLNFFKSRAKIYLTLAAIDPKYHEPAAEELKNARALAPTDPKLAYNLGLVYSRLNKPDLAAENLRDAISLKPNYADAYYALTLLYEQSKQADKLPELMSAAKQNLATYSSQLKEKIDKYSDN